MSPQVARGTLTISPTGSAGTQTIVFQYNPAQLRRTLVPQFVGGEASSRSQSLLYANPPTETIDLQLEIDALDQDPASGVGPRESGILPQLCALEMALYPSTAKQTALASAMATGTLEVGAAAVPQVQFGWGGQRSAPVQISELSITEEAFDATLSPIRASIELKMRVISSADVDPGDPNYSPYLAYQRSKETLAKQGYGKPPG
jgi:hypothetical protein